MPFAQSTSKYEQDIINERNAEYQQLQLALRMAQADRVRYVEELSSAKKKMKKTIDELEQEEAELREKLDVVDNKSNQLRDQKVCETLLNLAKNKDWLEEQIKTERSMHADLDMKMKNAEKRVEELKLKVSGTEGMHSSYDRNSAKMTTLQNRLVYRLKMYNEALGHNANATQRIQQLTERAEKDVQQHNNEMKELIRSIDHAKKLRKFMQTKATERQEDPMLTAWKAKRIQEAEENRAAIDRKVDNYTNALNRMMALAGEESADSLVDSFLEKEDRNFALFTYLSELNIDNGKMRAQNAELARVIASLQRETTNQMGGRNDELIELQNKSDDATADLSILNEGLEHNNGTIQRFCTKVGDLVTRLNCDTNLLDRRLASPDAVTPENLLDHLKLVEDRIDKLLLVRQFRVINNPEHPFMAKSLNMDANLTPPSPGVPKIKAPAKMADSTTTGTSSDPSSDISALKPFSRSELHQRVVDKFEHQHDNQVTTTDDLLIEQSGELTAKTEV